MAYTKMIPPAMVSMSAPSFIAAMRKGVDRATDGDGSEQPRNDALEAVPAFAVSDTRQATLDGDHGETVGSDATTGLGGQPSLACAVGRHSVASDGSVNGAGGRVGNPRDFRRFVIEAVDFLSTYRNRTKQ